MSQEIKYEPQFTMRSNCGMSDEVIHTFHIDWLPAPNDDISFESTFLDVMNALTYIQQNLTDYYSGCGVATVATFFKILYRTDIIDLYPMMKEVGWNMEMLDECEISWLSFWITKMRGTKNDYIISPGFYPEEGVWENCSESSYEVLYTTDAVQ